MPATKSKPRPKKGEDTTLSARRRVYDHLQHKIMSGEIARGTMLSELGISRELRVSRTPVREAIGQLAADGIVEQKPNRSSVVVDLSRTDIIDLYEVREALETFAVRKASERALAAATVDQLRQTLSQLEAIGRTLAESGKSRLDAPTQASYMLLDLRLHALLVLSTQNARMQKIVSETRLLVRIFSLRKEGHDLQALTQIHEQHREIVEAVIQRDGERAAKLLALHIRHSLQERLEELDIYTRERLMQEHSLAFGLSAETAIAGGSGARGLV